MSTKAPTPMSARRMRISQTLGKVLLGRTMASAATRLALSIVALAVFWLLAIVSAGFPGEIPLALVRSLPPLLYPVLNALTPFFAPQVLRTMLAIAFGIGAGLFLAARYLSDLFELESLWMAIRYLLGAIFGLSYARLTIDRGPVERLDPGNPIRRIGGPGFIQTSLGFAAVFEDQRGRPRIYGLSQPSARSAAPPPRAQHFVRGFETLREVVDLRDRMVTIDEMRAETLDGVEVYARDAQLMFRVYSGGKERSLAHPYPFTEAGVRSLVYAQPVENGRRPSAENLVAEIMRREIQSFVGRHRFEELLAMQPSRSAAIEAAETPTETKASPRPALHIPRRQLTEHFHSEAVQAALRRIGLELAWIGVGTWEIRDTSDIQAGRTGLGKTLAQNWRDAQRARMYRSPAYLERLKVRRTHERLNGLFAALLQAWHEGDLPKRYRAFECVRVLRGHLDEARRRLERDPELDAPKDLAGVLALLDQLTQPMTLGAEDDDVHPAP